ncbi:MAG: alpha-2-macroglobulin, partial [Acidobacteriota bacterium]|nr:alpha-2-macroglobulin [Acidobacteriota bacterium]
MRSSIPATLLLAGALALVAPACQQLQADPRPGGSNAATDPDAANPRVPAPMNATAAWKEIDRLLGEQKLQEAADRLAPLVASARAAGDEATWAKALVRQSQVRTALGGLETAVAEMKAAAWPAGATARAAVELYYAHALLEYLSGYSWEIRQRERVVSDEQLDLKAWTAEQIAAEAERSFLAVWERREELGSVAVGDFPYLQANDFPKGIRDSLRDAVSYLFVERLLGDSSFWSASEANEVWQLDLGNLLAERPDVPAGAVHPLLRAVAVLADLEQWHRGRRELGAELQAYLHREALLSEHRQGEADRRRRREALEQRLPRFRGDPWWSMGVYSLAQDLDQVASDPERRIRARALALEGERAYPGTHGAQRCRQLIAQIESPDYQLQSMTVDGADRRSIEITHRNLAALYLRAYPVDLAAQLGRAEFRGFFPTDAREIERLLATATPVAEWKVALPPTADYLPHRTFVTPPLAKAGTYLLVASAGRGFGESGNRRVALAFTLSDLVLLEEGQHLPWRVRLVSGRTGAPAGGVEVALYRNTWRAAPERIATVRTDAAGRAEFAATVAAANGATNLLLVARRGDDVAFAQRYGGGPQPGATPHPGALLFTDRAIYRPQQKLYFKLLAYRRGGAPGDLELAPETAVGVWLSDPNGEKVAEIEVATNKFGTAAGEFEIPAGRLLGQWTLATSLDGGTMVRVEEYKRPTFEVEIAEPATQLRLNRPAALAGAARYYFGLPVTSGRVAWRVTRHPELPWWWRFWGWSGATEPQQIASGTTTLDPEGKFAIAFTPLADEQEKKGGLTYSYRLESEVTDDGGETRSGERTVRLGWVAVETELTPESALAVEGHELRIRATRRDLNAVARPGAGRWHLFEIDQPTGALLPADLPMRPFGAPADEAARFATAGDRLRPRWSQGIDTLETLALFADGREVRSGELTHAAKGEGAIVLADLAAGAYRLRYETKDDFGESFRTQLDFYVAGKQTPLAVPVAIAFDRTTAQPGESVRLWLHSGLAETPAEVELWRGEERLWRRPVTLAGSQWLDVPVTEKDRGGFSARLTLVRDHQLLSQGARLEVPWKNKELSVEFASFRDKLTPGAKESFRVTVKDARGRPVEAGAAELLASMYDKSLDLFAPFHAPRALTLFPNWTSVSFPALSANLAATGPLWVRDESWVKSSPVESLRGDALVE